MAATPSGKKGTTRAVDRSGVGPAWGALRGEIEANNRIWLPGRSMANVALAAGGGDLGGVAPFEGGLGGERLHEAIQRIPADR